MKKLLVSVLTVGALAGAGAASAQDVIGNVLGTILGNIGITAPPSAVAGATHSGGRIAQDNVGRMIYVDPSGRTAVIDENNMIRDQYGRRWVVDGGGNARLVDGNPVIVDPGAQAAAQAQGRAVYDAYGRRIHYDAYGRPAYIEQNGQLYPYGSVTGQVNRRDRDGDGVRNRDDRYPDDPRYR